jgi:hypothetical protein
MFTIDAADIVEIANNISSKAATNLDFNFSLSP